MCSVTTVLVRTHQKRSCFSFRHTAYTSTTLMGMIHRRTFSSGQQPTHLLQKRPWHMHPWRKNMHAQRLFLRWTRKFLLNDRTTIHHVPVLSVGFLPSRDCLPPPPTTHTPPPPSASRYGRAAVVSRKYVYRTQWTKETWHIMHTWRKKYAQPLFLRCTWKFLLNDRTFA